MTLFYNYHNKKRNGRFTCASSKIDGTWALSSEKISSLDFGIFPDLIRSKTKSKFLRRLLVDLQRARTCALTRSCLADQTSDAGLTQNRPGEEK